MNSKFKIRTDKGFAIAFFVLSIPVLIGFCCYVIDRAQVYNYTTRVKSAVDLATLAGVSQLNGTSSISTAKSTALQYLNNNLALTIPNFTNLSSSDPNLSIQAGIYDSATMTFTWDELSSNVNSIKVTYTYSLMTSFSGYFMIDNIDIAGSSTAAKQIASNMQPGTGFPLAIDNTTLATALSNSNMIDLYASGSMDNSYWTDYTGSNPSTTDIRNVLNYFQTGMGTSPPGIAINDSYRVNDGGMGGVFNDLDPSVLVGMTYIFSVVTLTSSNTARADGFIAATITQIVNSMGSKYISVTFQPGYIDNTFGGLQVGSTATNVSSGNQSLLANAYGIVL